MVLAIPVSVRLRAGVGRASARRRWLLLLALVLGFAGGAAPVGAQGVSYEVSGIRVDVTAESAAAARDKALKEGARRALQELVARYVEPEKRARYARMSQQQIDDMIADFSIRDEKTSAVRYIATLDFRFKPSRASRLLRDAGVTTPLAPGEPGSAPPPPPLVVVPVLEGTIPTAQGSDAWRSAWRAIAERRPGRYVVAGADNAAIAGDQAQVAALVRRLGGDSGLVAVATPGTPAADGTPQSIDVRFLRQGRTRQASGAATYTIQEGETADAFVRRVAAAVDQAQAQAWRGAGQTPAASRAQVDVFVPVDDLADWLALQKSLRQVEGVRKVDLLMASRREMFVGIAYSGSYAQLEQNLADADFALVSADGRRMLSRDTSPIAPVEEPAAAAEPARPASAGPGKAP
jgi:hypothetical protein